MSDDLLNRMREALAGRYQVEGELDRGGMAVVYLAKDLRHDRKVAIKVLDPSLSAGLGTERFLREIDVIAKLEHPNILTLIDSGEVEGLPYYVMPFVKGQSLAALLEREKRLPLRQAIQIAGEVAEALQTAHQQGIIHRDIKPSNVLLSGGHAVVADFGIAAALDQSKVGRLTKAGSSLGSPIYMSPEQASGEGEPDGRTDIYALGCMLYEMLGGEPPFDGSLEAVVSRKVLGEFRPLKEINPDVPPEIDRAISKALEREPDKRFATAGEFKEVLLAGLPTEVPKGWGRKQTLATTAVGAVVAVGALLAIYWLQQGNERLLWATQTLAEVEQLAAAGQLTEALDRALEVEDVFPGDTTLGRLYPTFSYTMPIRTEPPGARVFIQDLESPGREWDFLGVTPLEEVRFAGYAYERPGGRVSQTEDRPHRLRFELEGFETRDLLKTAVIGLSGQNLPTADPVVLEPVSPELEGMVRIPGFTEDSVVYADFFMDRYEVTNRAFKEFVDDGGYRNSEFWVHPFVQDGVDLSFVDAMALFRDQTGQPGASTWRLGDFPDGQGDFPVGGVSWYEADAYARWAGKELPTVLQWQQGRLYFRRNSYVVIPRSNLGSDGPRSVGMEEAMTTLGVYDMAGNVREWCYNEAGEGERATRGGAWSDAPFHVGHIIPKAAFDRDATHGFRLIRAFDDQEVLEALRYPVDRTVPRDFLTEEPVADAEFELLRQLYAYDRFPLNAQVERADTFEHWVRETVTFDLPYGERGGVFLFLPTDAQRPLQPILYWGGSGILNTQSIDHEFAPSYEYMILDGRAVAIPLFKGAYGRDAAPSPGTEFPGPYTSSTYRDATIQWVKDLSATIDYLEDREDIDHENAGYFGYSFGARIGPIPLVVDPRIDVAVLNNAGLNTARFHPVADAFNFVPRVRTPVLMINGEFDIVFPLQTTVLPMFELLGTRTEDKDHYITPAAHFVPLDVAIRETLAWFDKYLGVPGG